MSHLHIQFRLGSIPVRIEPSFWLITLILGVRLGSAAGIALWTALELVAVLVHELGHALTARAFGAEPSIVLHSMGGITRYQVPKTKPYGRWHSVATSFAGPMAGFVLALVTFLGAMLIAPGGGSPLDRALTVWSLALSPRADSMTSLALALTLWINVGWGLINLLPILPLDGGNIVRALLSGASPESGTVRALWVSAVVGPAVVVLLFKAGMPMAGMLFGYFVFASVRQLLEARKNASDRREGLYDRLDDAQRALREGNVEQAEALASGALDKASSPIVRRTALHLVAAARLQRGDARSALDALRNLPDNETDPLLLGATLLECGRAEDAIPHLERAIRLSDSPHARDLLESARRVAQVWNGGA